MLVVTLNQENYYLNLSFVRGLDQIVVVFCLRGFEKFVYRLYDSNIPLDFLECDRRVVASRVNLRRRDE